MTTWEEIVCGTGLRLSELAHLPGGRDPNVNPRIDLDVAVTARAAVLAGAAVVLQDLSAVPRELPTSGRMDMLAMAERDPVRALAIRLQGRGRPRLTRSPSELLDAAAPGSDVTRRWAAVGRDALWADQMWSAVVRQLDGEHAWHAVREVAALIELVTACDQALRTVVVAASRPDLVAYLDCSIGLRLIAREVRSLADAPTGREPESPTRAISGPEPRRVIAPTDGRSACAAIRRLTTLVKDADVVAPAHVRVVATLGRDLSILAARAGALTADGRPLREGLSELVAELHQVVLGRHGEAVMVECHAPALEHQIRELARYTHAALGGRAPLPDNTEASRIAGRVPRLLGVLAEQTRTQVDHRRWAIPDRSQRTCLRYTIATRQDPDRMPRMLTELERAIAAASELRLRNDSRAVPGTPTSTRVAATLMENPRGSLAPLRRPSHPAVPPREHLPPSA
ncbi:hypothetical protein [Sporichthya sp.]|uniref:hypothetical protein n=1 Tax=Sporichthya sp. TaxID=65475 RepID=UPI0025F07BC3|nr:hypothetical protein [Sporichthya sp.]